MQGRLAHVALSTVLLAALAPAAGAATLCVRPGGHGGCYASITEAVASAAPYDIVRVYPGTYAESVRIDKPLSLLGTNRAGIMIFAAGTITGTVVAQNQIEREEIAIAVKTPSAVDLHLNDLDNHRTGVANLGNGTIDATENWWGCGAGPGNPGCASADGAGIRDTPALSQPVFHDERSTATKDERGRKDRHP